MSMGAWESKKRSVFRDFSTLGRLVYGCFWSLIKYLAVKADQYVMISIARTGHHSQRVNRRSIRMPLDEAEAQLMALPARDRRTVEAAILARLGDQPMTPTKAIKRLRTSPVAEFELRVGDFRVLYDVADEEVVLLIVSGGRSARS